MKIIPVLQPPLKFELFTTTISIMQPEGEQTYVWIGQSCILNEKEEGLISTANMNRG